MKIITLATLVFITTLSAQAMDLIVPQGDYKYVSAEISFLRDVQLFSVADDAGTQRYEALKLKKYVCRFYPGDMVNCYKFLENEDSVQIPENEVMRVVPSFGHKTRSEIESINEYEIVYNVFQPVDMPVGVAEGYRLHVRESGDYLIEVFLDGNILRYRYGNPKRLRLQIKKRKTVGDNHFLEYGIHSIYEQI